MEALGQLITNIWVGKLDMIFIARYLFPSISRLSIVSGK